MIDQWISDVFHGFFPPGPDPAGRSYGCAGTVRRTCSGQGIASDSLSLCWWDFTSFIRYYHIYIYTQCGDPHHEIYIEMTKTPIGHGLPVFDEIGDGLLLGFTGFTTL